MSLRLRQVSAAALPPVVFGLLFFGAWEWAVRAFEVEEYFLVPPSKILSTFADNWSLIWESVQVTGANALVGLLLGTALGVAVAFLLMSFRSLDQVITPLSTALNALPIFVGSADVLVATKVTSKTPDGKTTIESGSRWIATTTREGQQWKISNLIQVI